jgi:ribonuclease P protein component
MTTASLAAALTQRAELSFRPAYRLHKTDEYSSVFAFRRSLRGRYFGLAYRPNQLGSARLGLVIGKKQAKLAFTRNLIKRQAREAFRHARADLPTLDLVLRLTAPASQLSRREIRADIEALLARLDTLNLVRVSR